MKDLHAKPFDEGTIAKLEIFEDYAQAWLPTFIMQSKPEICIFDLFAGTGYDLNGIQGSPIRILEKVNEYLGIIFKNKVHIKLYLNEFEPTKKKQEKFEILKEACNAYLDKNKAVKRALTIEYYNEDFATLFPKLIPAIKKNPSLVYLDQNGIKFLESKYLLELEKINETDFIYFVSSSYFKRFGKTEEFRAHFEVDIDEINSNPYRFIHRIVLNQLKSTLPSSSRLKLYPFTIKKGKNIYGIIFGAKHPRAVDKFLDISWKKNSVNGDANFDIDDDTNKKQFDLFSGSVPLTKIEAFKQKVEVKILSKEISNNFELLNFVYDEGHLPKHASDCLKELNNKKLIKYASKSPLVNYDNVHKKERLLEYIIL